MKDAVSKSNPLDKFKYAGADAHENVDQVTTIHNEEP